MNNQLSIKFSKEHDTLIGSKIRRGNFGDRLPFAEYRELEMHFLYRASIRTFLIRIQFYSVNKGLQAGIDALTTDNGSVGAVVCPT